MVSQKTVQSRSKQNVVLQPFPQQGSSLKPFLKSEQAAPSFSETEVFYCPEESYFYSYCLERFILSPSNSRSQVVVEFGCGDGTPVIHSLARNAFSGVIHGYDLNPSACEIARARIESYQLSDRYVIHHESFFDAAKPEADYLIANPPYLPSPDEQILMPALRGGIDGSEITCQLLSFNYPAVLLMVSSYSNPTDTIQHALKNGYSVADFMVSPLQFGYYSSEQKVKATIQQLKHHRQAFYSDHIYFLAGVLFKRSSESDIDLSSELIRVMTAL